MSAISQTGSMAAVGMMLDEYGSGRGRRGIERVLWWVCKYIRILGGRVEGERGVFGYDSYGRVRKRSGYGGPVDLGEAGWRVLGR